MLTVCCKLQRPNHLPKNADLKLKILQRIEESPGKTLTINILSELLDNEVLPFYSN